MSAVISARALKKGVKLHDNKRYTEAIVCYLQGITYLFNSVGAAQDLKTKEYIRRKLYHYIDRANTVRELITEKQESGEFHEKVPIKNNSIGNSYLSLFGRFLDEHVQFVRIEDPFVRNIDQITNFVILCELLVKCCEGLRGILLVTSCTERTAEFQMQWFNMLADEYIANNNVRISVQYMDPFRERQILLNSGWILKIDRGLDIYKPWIQGNMDLSDQDLRPCYETTLDIFYRKNLNLGN